MAPPSALSGPVPPLGMANFRHVTKCRGGSGGDLPSFLPVRCLMLKLVHPQISKPWECHLYFAQGCHLNFALTSGSRVTVITENLDFRGGRTRSAFSTSLREKLIKIGAKVVRHGRYVTFQMAEVAVSRRMFADILPSIARLRAPPAPA